MAGKKQKVGLAETIELMASRAKAMNAAEVRMTGHAVTNLDGYCYTIIVSRPDDCLGKDCPHSRQSRRNGGQL